MKTQSIQSREPRALSRRFALRVAAGAISTAALVPLAADAQTQASPGGTQQIIQKSQSLYSQLPERQIEQIVGASGKMTHGLLHINIERKDITGVTSVGSRSGVPFTPAFQINGDFFFQALGDGTALMNADFPLRTGEVDAFIDRLLANDLVFQAEHQHFFDIRPEVWFVHFRGRGDPLKLARGIKAALGATGVPLPQSKPANAQTRLPAQQLGRIIGAKPSVGSDGVVDLLVPRHDVVNLGGVDANPYLNIMTPVSFMPWKGGAAAVSDFAMTAGEIQHVVRHMRALGWISGCLYNQEIDEQPQLYFDHMWKTGDPVTLAREIRSGLALNNSA